MTSEIAGKATFAHIRYAQLWEDADVLVSALKDKRDATFVSICSAGDNALAMLTLDPKRVIVVDLSSAQIECLKLRMAAMRLLGHAAYLELLGARPSVRRGALFDAVCATMDGPSQAFWAMQRGGIEQFGAGGVGKFEHYFRIMQTRLLPLVHSKATIDDVFVSRPPDARQRFYDTRWNNWRWRLLLKGFFSRFAMGRLGRDPAFFDHVEGSVSEHVARRIVHAAVRLDPADNPYLHWILKGTMGKALPLAWRPENYEVIRSRLDRLDVRVGSFEALIAAGEKADGFNLSDIFEYMDPATFAVVYGQLMKAANPGARLVYWNMMAPRRMPPAFAGAVRTRTDLEAVGKAMDKAFFYSDFVVEEVVGSSGVSSGP
jgi:S-adenosylmethionine-diacylglycerol 3-amino-3-carboxypropyl transferase